MKHVFRTAFLLAVLSVLNVNSEFDGFSIEVFPKYKVVTNNYATEAGHHVKFVVYPRGTIPPRIENASYFATPIESVAVEQTVPITFMELLGVRPRIHFVQKFTAPYVTSPCVNNLLKAGTIETYEKKTSEKLHNTTLFFGSHHGLGNTKLYKRFVADSTTSTLNPKHRAEWLKFYAVFFEKEALANELVEKINHRYECHKKLAQGYSKNSRKPVVAWTSFYKSGNVSTWYISTAAYKRHFIEDAGAKPLEITGGKPGWGSRKYRTLAEFLKAIKTVDLLIDESYLPTKRDYATALKSYGWTPSSGHKLVTTKKVYRYDGLMSATGGTDWFEGSIPEPDVVLEDLMTALFPKSGHATRHKPTWFRGAHQNPVIAGTECSKQEAASPLKVRADACPTDALKTSPKKNGAQRVAPFSAVFVTTVVCMLVALW